MNFFNKLHTKYDKIEEPIRLLVFLVIILPLYSFCYLGGIIAFLSSLVIF